MAFGVACCCVSGTIVVAVVVFVVVVPCIIHYADLPELMLTFPCCGGGRWWMVSEMANSEAVVQ